MKKTLKCTIVGVIFAMLTTLGACGTNSGRSDDSAGSSPSAAEGGAASANQLDPTEVRNIVKDAYIYGFPMVDMYRAVYTYTDKSGSEYRGPWNEVINIPRVYTPKDTTVQTPNSDTPYSQIAADLRSGPLVITVPPVEAGRYFSVAFHDAYTYIYKLLGSRTTGNGGGKYLLAGPGWQGEKPAGIDEVIRSSTDYSYVLFRTQLFDANDLDNVKKVQAGYKVEPFSTFEKKPAPNPTPPADLVAALTPEQQKTSLDFFKVLNYTLQRSPVLPAEQELRARLATIGLTGKGTFDPAQLNDAAKAAFTEGVKDAWTEANAFIKNDLTTGKVPSRKLFGNAEQLNGNYLYRMVGAVVGLFGLPGEEAAYFTARVDSAGSPLNAANGTNYTITFPANQLPPANAFWSVTMYRMPESLLVENPINRYLINSPMLSQLKKNPDGSITLYLQHASPGADKESNWLPAPDGLFASTLRLYWPKPEVLDGRWQAPRVVKQ